MERLLDFSEHFRPNMAFRYWVRSCDWRILRCIEREEKEETFFGVSSSLPSFLSGDLNAHVHRIGSNAPKMAEATAITTFRILSQILFFMLYTF